MKKVSILAIVMAAVLLCGCDGFRKLAGRPTSDEIEAKRVRIEEEKAAHQARLDSLRKMAIADSLAVADSLRVLDEMRHSSVMTLTAKRICGVRAAELDHKYYVIVGTFGDRQNAESHRAKIEAKGYRADLVPYRNAMTAVGINGTDSIVEAWESLKKVKGESFCPADAWMLVNE